MVSNHRLVLFTHALCRLSYPAINEICSDPLFWRTYRGSLAKRRSLRPCSREVDQRVSRFLSLGFAGPLYRLFGIFPELTSL